ncbi:MAG TPA: hypothetical protein VG820_06380 [Fimbriimonadaceae bacterium]|nr:hypothetical protein [Fimbriimonadaceae bacterium]
MSSRPVRALADGNAGAKPIPRVRPLCEPQRDWSRTDPAMLLFAVEGA